MLTPEICEAVLYRGEDVPFCPKMINGMIMEQNFDDNKRMRQSYIETKLFGSDVTGEIINSLPLTKTGMKSSYQKKLDAMAAQFDVLCALNHHSFIGTKNIELCSHCIQLLLVRRLHACLCKRK